MAAANRLTDMVLPTASVNIQYTEFLRGMMGSLTSSGCGYQDLLGQVLPSVEL